MYKTGKLLGSGGSKSCYTVEGEPDKAVLVYTYREGDTSAWFKTEMNMLKKIADTGAPTFSYELVEVEYEGKPTTGALCKRYDKSFKVGWTDEKELTIEHAASLKKIADALKKADLTIADLQFLATKDGEVVIADPLALYEKGSTGGYDKSYTRVNTLISQIEKNTGKKVSEAKMIMVDQNTPPPRKPEPVKKSPPIQLKTPKPKKPRKPRAKKAA